MFVDLKPGEKRGAFMRPMNNVQGLIGRCGDGCDFVDSMADTDIECDCKDRKVAGSWHR